LEWKPPRIDTDGQRLDHAYECRPRVRLGVDTSDSNPNLTGNVGFHQLSDSVRGDGVKELKKLVFHW
jgi:hypothetical protein